MAFATAKAWDAWLTRHHASARGLWLKLAKKASGTASVTYPEALTVALAWGWIDGQKQGLDDTHWLQRFTPRRPKSLWSKINRDKALALIASGAMKPAGLAEVERAQADGRWDAAYAGAKTITVPDDLAAALATNGRARRVGATLERGRPSMERGADAARTGPRHCQDGGAGDRSAAAGTAWCATPCGRLRR